jgi:NTP pyrophosphatase (non-canonical NTP hydrolase)
MRTWGSTVLKTSSSSPRAWGLDVRFLPTNMEGLYVAGEKPVILLSSPRSLSRRNFTCGHELGHKIFGHAKCLDVLMRRDPYWQRTPPRGALTWGEAMDISECQREAQKTDQLSLRGSVGMIVPLLGRAGETGELLSEYKKHLRNGRAHRLFKVRVAEELGHLLWYLANVASKFDLDLGEVARLNIEKCRNRWGARGAASVGHDFDGQFPKGERLPRQFIVESATSRARTSQGCAPTSAVNRSATRSPTTPTRTTDTASMTCSILPTRPCSAGHRSRGASCAGSGRVTHASTRLRTAGGHR